MSVCVKKAMLAKAVRLGLLVVVVVVTDWMFPLPVVVVSEGY